MEDSSPARVDFKFLHVHLIVSTAPIHHNIIHPPTPSPPQTGNPSAIAPSAAT
jgi:hypothetical protein